MAAAAPTPSTNMLLRQVQAAFGLSQVALGRLLGLSANMTRQVMGGHRPLPPTAYVAFSRLVLALDALPAAAPAAAEPDPDGLRQHQLECLAAAQRLSLELLALAGRAAWATRRLAALPGLQASVGVDEAGAVPRWLVRFGAEAREALAAAGPDAQARLLLRRAALWHEAQQLGRLLAGAAIAELESEGTAPTFTAETTSLNPFPTMAFSADRFTTRAQCVAYLTRKATERLALVARQNSILVQLANWDALGDPAAALVATQTSITTMTPMVAAMEEGPRRRKIENMISDLEKQANTLEGRAESHGPDDLLDHEQDRDETASDLVVHDQLVAAVQARHDVLTA